LSFNNKYGGTGRGYRGEGRIRLYYILQLARIKRNLGLLKSVYDKFSCIPRVISLVVSLLA